jgi:predicted transcriptional regulator
MAPPTDRQMQIAELRSKGLTQGQIAEKLGVARSTVARDWSAVKAEMSDLPIGYEEPTVIEPVNLPNLSNSIVVTLNAIDFEKFRDSKVLYSKSSYKERFGRNVLDTYVFEARNNNIVHSTWLGQTPAKYYPRLSKISLKHSIDATELLSEIVDFFFEAIRAIRPQTGEIGPGTSGQGHGKRGKYNTTLEDEVNRVFRDITSELDESKIEQIYKIVTKKWLAQVEEQHSQILTILNDLLSETLDSSAYKWLRRDEPVGDFVDFIIERLPSISPEELVKARNRFSQCTKPYDVFYSHVNNMIDTALGMHGIIGDEIPIARYHKIASPELLHSFLESGAQTLDEYNKLINAGFESTYDRDEFREMWEVIEGMLPYRTTKAGDWEFAGKSGKKYNQLLERNWTRKRLLIAKDVQEATGKRADFDTGPNWIDALGVVDWPIDIDERQTLMSFTKSVDLENLASWVTPKYDHELINYVFTSRRRYDFPHARATFEALMNRGHIFGQIAPRGVQVNPTDDAFIQKYGLGWAKSELTPSLYLVLQIVRKSHQKQISLTNLFREGKAETGASWYANEEILERDISENLGKYCVVQPNGIVQIVGRKKQPVSNEDAIEVYEEEREKMLTSLVEERPHNINKKRLSKQLGVKAVELPCFFERVEAEEIHALRLARVIRDDDLPQACHLVWRYFVKLVAPLKSRYNAEDDPFVYDIDFAAERFDLKKGQINVLHDVRKIRNDVDHDDNDIKPPNPTWKRVVGVLKVCELIK